MIRQLLARGILIARGEYGTLALGEPAAARAARRDARCRCAATCSGAPAATARVRKTAASDSLDAGDRPLFEALREWRAGVAKELGVPAYIVFGDATLRALAEHPSGEPRRPRRRHRHRREEARGLRRGRARGHRRGLSPGADPGVVHRSPPAGQRFLYSGAVLPSRSLPAVLIASALILLAGCAAAPAPEPATTSDASTTPDPSTPSAEPSPVAQPKVPFDGDCERVISSDALSALFDGETMTPIDRGWLAAVMPDVADSTELIGGVTCAWDGDSDSSAYLSVFVVPLDAVPAETVEARAEFACFGWGMCGRGETQSGMWVFASTYGSAYEDPSPEESAALERTVDAAIASVSQQPAELLTGVAVPPAPDWWSVNSCSDLESIASAAGMTSPTAGFPSDNIPEGPLWETLTAVGAVSWCPWHEFISNGAILTEVYVQPGIGAPSESELVAASAEPISISGADVAYRITEGEGSARNVRVVAVVGPNRLTVSGDEPEAVAEAAIAVLGS